jgi:hypothetical protein
MSGRSEARRPVQSGGEFSRAQRAGLDARQADQDRTLVAMHELEAALGEAAPGREQDWHQSVLSALAVLDEATTEEAANAERPDSLLSDIARTQPRLRNRARGVRLQYRHLREVLAALRQELGEQPGGASDFSDVRQRLGWLLTSLRHQRARESDLICEAYFEAFRADLAAEAGATYGSAHQEKRPEAS